MHFLGLAGMPRRIPDYALQFTNFNMIATVGAFVFGFSQLLFLYNVVQTVRKHGRKSGMREFGKVLMGWSGLFLRHHLTIAL